MMLASSNSTYLPDGPDYYNYSLYGGQPQAFPGPGYGMPSSPAYQSMAPPRMDLMARGNQWGGSGAFAPPGGINFGNPLMNMFGTMALTSMFGSELRPLMQPAMPAFDYFQARQRYSISEGMSSRVLDADPIYGSASAPELTKMNLTRSIFDMFNPAGSQRQAFETIYGRFGGNFGGSLAGQAEDSLKMLKQLNGAFTIGGGRRGGMWDFNQSYGMDRVETAEALDAASRYGIGGLSMDSVSDASGKGDGSLMKLARDNNKIFAQARDIFGKDKGFDELARLMSESIEGLSGLDQGTASNLLSRIQSTARAVNISSEAFSAYAGMFNQLYRDRNIGGATALEGVANSLESAGAISTAARGSGDMIAGDQNRMSRARGEQNAKAANSRLVNTGSAIGLQLDDMTDSQKSAVRMKDGRSLKDWEAEFKKAMGSGDTATAAAFQSSFMENLGDNKFFTKGDLILRSMNLSMEDRERMGDKFDWARDPARFQNNRFLKKLDQNIAGRLGEGSRLSLARLGLSVTDLRQEFDGAELTDANKIRARLGSDPRFAGMSAAERDDIATSISAGSAMLNNSKALRGFFDGSDPLASARGAITGDSREGRAALAKTQERRRMNGLRQQYLQGLTGASLKGLDAKELIGTIVQNWDKISGAFGEKGFDFEKAKAAAFSITKDVVKAEEMAELMKAAQGGMEPTVSKAQAEFDRVAKATGSQSKAGAARDAVLEAERQKFIKDWNESDRGDGFIGPRLTPEQQEALDAKNKAGDAKADRAKEISLFEKMEAHLDKLANSGTNPVGTFLKGAATKVKDFF